MTVVDITIVISVIIALAALRLGLPMLVMWLVNKGCCILRKGQLA